jgi:Spy/CpxP family protein refolding chaperone
MRQGRSASGIFLVMVVLSVFLAAGTVEAATKKPAAAGGSSKVELFKAEAEKVMNEMNLPLAKKARLKVIGDEFLGRERSINTALRAKKANLKKELEKDDPSRAEADRLSGEIKALQSEQLDNRVENVFRVREILTPEQYRQFKELREKRKAGPRPVKPRKIKGKR